MSDMIFGIIIGIVQLPLLGFFIIYFAPNLSPFLIFAVFIPLIIEIIMYNKKNPLLLKGIVIGTILIPVLAFGACFLIFYGH